MRFFKTQMILLILFTSISQSSEELSQKNPENLESNVFASLKFYCHSCHSQTTKNKNGNFKLEQLTSDFSNPKTREAWLLIVERIKSGEMPPKEKPKPSKKEIEEIFNWVQSCVKIADSTQSIDGRVVLRRLNNTEYENTLRDLLGVPLELKAILPQDGTANGFDNIGEALHTSSFLMDKYLEGADIALKASIANFPQPPLFKKQYSLKDMHPVKTTTEKVFRNKEDGTVVCFSSSPWQAVTLSSFYPADRGRYKFRISASGVQSNGKPVVYRVDAGTMWMNGKSELVGYFDAPADNPTILEFTWDLEPRGTIRILPYGLANSQSVNKIGADSYDGPGLAIQWVEVEGPIYESWPPPSHRRIFGDLPTKPAPIYNFSKRVEISSTNPEFDAEKIIRNFAKKAFRRTITTEEIQPYLSLVKTRLDEKYSFEQAIRVGLMAILVSKDFLFLQEKRGKLDDFAIANRLSYFLWSTMPDEELLELAEQKKLNDPEVLRAQVERMLKNPKASSFTKNFTGQWLNLREIDATIPSQIIYPHYDEMLKASMLRETYLFFEEVLKNDLSITNFIASDFSMLNGRLAKHYNIPGVDGWEFQKVQLPKDSHRGGLLTMASVLKVTANGTYTSPILRGSWVLERILGTPPPRPPEGISAVEPDIRGATTIREQLSKHRSMESCASCHTKIDPLGFAMESYDVIGGWRDYYVLDGRPAYFRQGRKIDPSDVLPDGRKFANIDELKLLLLEDKNLITRALTERLVTYATGAPIKKIDQSGIDKIIAKIGEKGHGFKSLIHEIVASDFFLNK